MYRKVLVVEDEIVSLHYLCEILRELDFQEICEAGSAEAAFQIIEQERIDLIFMDINIRGPIDGIAATRQINNRESIPVIYTTAYKDSETIAEAARSNMYGYVIKPFSKWDIEAAISVVFARRQQELMNRTNIPDSVPGVIDFGDGHQYRSSNRTYYIDRIPQELTRKEMELLDVFCIYRNQNLPYEMIKNLVWGEKNVSDSTLRDSVSKLKRKLPKLEINNISNFGYILKCN